VAGIRGVSTHRPPVIVLELEFGSQAVGRTHQLPAIEIRQVADRQSRGLPAHTSGRPCLMQREVGRPPKLAFGDTIRELGCVGSRSSEWWPNDKRGGLLVMRSPSPSSHFFRHSGAPTLACLAGEAKAPAKAPRARSGDIRWGESKRIALGPHRRFGRNPLGVRDWECQPRGWRNPERLPWCGGCESSAGAYWTGLTKYTCF